LYIGFPATGRFSGNSHLTRIMSQLTVAAPSGARWTFDEVATAHGKSSLGEVPLLEWTDLQACVDFYGVEGILSMLDGTSLRVSQQGIARRLKAAGKSDDEIATAILAFRPGKRTIATPTPVSRAKRAAAAAADKVNGDVVAAFLARVAAGEIQLDESGNVIS
jgi:hypothetical protein